MLLPENWMFGPLFQTELGIYTGNPYLAAYSRLIAILSFSQSSI